MEKKYRITRFTHIFKKDTVCALYSSLRIRPVYVEPEMAEAVWSFGRGTTVSEVIETISLESREKFINLIPVLEAAKIIVDADGGSDEDIVGYFQKHLLGHPYVSIAYFILTDDCNFGCKYCFVESHMPTKRHPKSMSTTTVLKGLDFFCRQIKLRPNLFEQEKTIVIYGGEPLLNIQSLRFLLEEIKIRKADGRLPQKTELSMVTNATLVTPEVAQLLAEHDVCVAVSIDGDRESTDAARQYRGGGAVFDDILRGYDILKHAGVNIGVSCTLSQQSMDDFDRTLAMFTDRLDVKSLGFNIVLSGNGYHVREDYDEKAAQAIIRAFKVFREMNIVEDRIMRKVDSFVKGEIYAFDCGASGGGQIVIAPDGQIGVCHGYLGNRKHFMTTVDDDQFDPRHDPVFLEWSRRSPLAMAACQDCVALGICGGGCPLNADNEEGTIWGLDKRFCVHCKMTLEWLIWDLYEKMMTAGCEQHVTG